jgi:hypothetical protein
MGDVMSVAQYSTALQSLRQAQSELMSAELAAVRQALVRARTAQGRVELNRRAQSKAARLLMTAKQADAIARVEELRSASLESEELGRQRLIAATAEMYRMDPKDVVYHKRRPWGRPSRAAMKATQDALNQINA